MPLYLEDVAASQVPSHLMALMQCIADEVIERPVTPGVAMELLRKHLVPMLSKEYAVLFTSKGQPSWNRIHAVYAELLFHSGGKDADLIGAALVVDMMWRHSTRPPREFVTDDPVDLASFLRIAGYARLMVPRTVRLPSGIDLQVLRFCKYCWRHARSAARVCAVHAVHSNPADAAAYKKAQRLRPAFEGEVLALASREELEFHNSQFGAPVLFPGNQVHTWLADRRPLLLEAIDQKGPVDLEQAVRHLFGSGELLPLYAAEPHLLTPVTLRAEAWLRAAAKKNAWGGQRAGAGTRSGKGAIDHSPTTDDPNLDIHS